LDLKQQLRNSKLETAKTHDALAATPYSAVKQTSTTPRKPAFDTSPLKQAKRNNFFAEDSQPGYGGVAGTSTSVTRASGNPSKAAENWLHSFRTELQRAIDEGRCLDMSLKALKDFLEKLYESKELAMSRLQQGTGNTAVETMEMHLYSSLEKKYGLRSIAAEQAGMVLVAVDKFAAEDNFVNVFHKIFRNEIEEDFWLVQKELMKSLRDLTMVQLMSRYPTKDQPTLLNMLDTKIAEGSISEDEWTDMVNYLYNCVDSAALCLMLKKLAAEEMGTMGIIVSDEVSAVSSSPQRNTGATGVGVARSPLSSSSTKHGLNAKTEMTRRLGYNSPSLRAQQQIQQQLQTKDRDSRASRAQLRLSFAAFQKCVLDFQLRSRLQYLSTFRAAFERCDTDFDGVLCAEEFRTCFSWLRSKSAWLQNINVGSNGNPDYVEDDEHALLTLLQTMDPRNTDRITFSTAAGTVSKAVAASSQVDR
jgi:hypothetical protein